MFNNYNILNYHRKITKDDVRNHLNSLTDFKIHISYVDYFSIRYIIIDSTRYYFLSDIASFFGFIHDRPLKVRIPQSDRILIPGDDRVCYAISPLALFKIITSPTRLVLYYYVVNNSSPEKLFHLFYPNFIFSDFCYLTNFNPSKFSKLIQFRRSKLLQS